MFRRIVSWVWRPLRIVLVAYLLLLLLMMIFEETFIFFPHPYDGGADWNPSGLEFEDAFFEAHDGTRLHGWFCPHEKPRAVVLFAHGNAGNLSHPGRVDVLRILRDRLRVSVMIFDYRGYGRSEGKPQEAGVLADARAARAWLANRAEIAETEIVLLGRSLGGGVMVDLAAEDDARGLVLESTFTSLPDVAAVHYPFLPARRLMRNRLESIAKIDRYKGPLLISHGNFDSVIPFELGKRLFDAAAGQKTFFTIHGGDHNDPQPPDYYAVLDRFFDELPSR